MQLKGLVRFFTIVLILVSLYVLSFTWFVRGHERKMETKARSFVSVNYPSATQKFPGNKDSQAVYQEQLNKIYQKRLAELLDSTKNKTVTYGFTGPISYKKAKEEELNLGLDLQGGMNVTLEVEMAGLLRTLSSNAKEANFNTALANAEKRKANSDADYITLFVEEYRKLLPNTSLAPLFVGNNNGLTVRSTDNEVISYLRTEANSAFDNTYRVLQTRIDQFGVAQPTINPNPTKGIIIVELPGIQDKERIRKLLQSSANLQIWETYPLTMPDMQNAMANADAAFDAFLKGTSLNDTTATTSVDTSATSTRIDTNAIAQNGEDTIPDLIPDTETPTTTTGKRSLNEYIIQQYNQGFTFLGHVKDIDTARVRRYLESPALRRYFPADARFAYGIPETSANTMLPLYALRTYGRDKAPIEGDMIVGASQDFDERSRPSVAMSMSNEGAAVWANLTDRTKQAIPLAIVLDNIVYSAPIASERISGGNSQITGSFSIQEAQDLANILKAGKLSVPAKIVHEQQVGPTLGREAIRGGSMAFLISFIVIFVLMLVYYNTSGWVANIALILNLLFTVGVLTALGATLTAPGIAGLVLTIGMAVDTNVIIYERIKEELSRGKGYIPAINAGYSRSLPPVLDGHITTLITAIILFYFGLGPVKGFATTQILGLLLSLFCGILVSRWITDLLSKKRQLEYFTGVSKKIFRHAKYKFIEYRKVAYVISFIVLGLGIASFFNGFDYGVEFNGGRSYTVEFGKPVDVEKVRDDLKVAFQGENAVIKTIGGNSTLDITTSYMINETATTVDSTVAHTLMLGLKDHLPSNITYEQFQENNIGAFNKVLPTISDDLKKGAINATIFALIAIFLYIFIRFRDWRYSLGTIIALLHDVTVTLIVFSFARSIVPFPLEIDQHFIAAILTVIGFSMNDTVIVFDRIREDTKLMPTAPRHEVINRAINETLSRTIMTSVTVFLTLLILFIVGGEVTKGFAFAMLIGVITGSYSSIFVAAPILVDLGTKKYRKESMRETKATTPATAS